MVSRHIFKKLAYSSETRVLLTKRYLTTSAQNCKWNFFSKEAEKKAGHSTLLSDRHELYELFVEDVKPEKWEDYLKHKEEMMKIQQDNTENKAVLIASLKFIAGDVNFRALHLFKYPQGWTDMDKTFKGLTGSSRLVEAKKFERQLITSQSTEYMKGFSFWPMPDNREGQNIYDVRSYELKPGSMYDWSNYWARGIRCRQGVRPDIAYGGFFSQLGQLHNIYHIWCYTDLADRKRCREGTWDHEEWNEVVSNTVPLIRSMSTRILKPLPFSPTQ